MSVLDLCDPDESTVLWSFDDPTGAANPYGVVTRLMSEVDIGQVVSDVNIFRSTAPGGVVVRRRSPEIEMAFQMTAEAAGYAELAAGLGQLARWLEVPPGPLRWTEDGEVLFADLLAGSNLPALLRGQRGAGIVALRSSSVGPIPFRLLRQPGLREAVREPALNLWSNATMLRDANDDGTPDGWTLEAGTQSISGEAFQISHGSAADLIRRDHSAAAATQVAVSLEARKVSGTRDVEIQLFTQASGTLLDTATVTGTAWTRYEVSGTVAGGDTGVRVRIRYVNGSGTTVAEFRDSQLETGTLVASGFRVGAEAVSNDPAATGGRSLVLVNSGQMLAPFDVTMQAESGDTPRIERVLVGLRASDGLGHRSLAEFLNETRFAQCDASGNGWTRTLEGSTSSVADANASGGNAAECAFTTPADATVEARRVRLERSTLLDSIRGYHDVYLTYAPMDAGDFRVRLRWSPSLADPVPYAGEEQILDNLDATSFAYSVRKLGEIYVSEDTAHTLGGLALEIWARRASGTGAIRFDTITLVPSDPLAGDQISILSVPGSSRESWLGKDLVTPSNPGGLSAGVDKNNRKRLDTAAEAAGTPPNTGLGWPAGRHTVEFLIDGKGTMTWVCRVRNITDSTTDVSRTITARKPSAISKVSLQFDSVAGKSYQPQLELTGGVGANEYLDIKRIRHSFTPYVGASEQMHTDPTSGLLEKLDSSGGVLANLGLEGPMPIWVPPGRHVVTVIPIDIKIHSGAADGRSVLARDLTFSARYAPRRPI